MSSGGYARGATLSPSLAGLGSTAGQAVAAELPKENLSKQLDGFVLSFFAPSSIFSLSIGTCRRPGPDVKDWRAGDNPRAGS